MTSHALLLRLFLSPTFFSLHLALKYLLIYADNIGITYYLTRRLRQLEVYELNEVWGFICHLLVTRPTKSRALEVFVVETAQRSSHIAMITLWFMQAALQDLSSARRDSQSFVMCQRILHKCHEIIFGDLPPPTSSPYASLKLCTHSTLCRKRVRHHPEPVFVGIGVVLAGTPGMPALADFTGQIAIEQGRVDDDGRDLRSLQMIEVDVAPNPMSIVDTPVTGDSGDADAEDTGSPMAEDSGESSPALSGQEFSGSSAPPTRRRTVAAAQTVPALPLHLRSIRRSRASEDPLGQLDPELPPTAPHQSSPSLSAFNAPYRPTVPSNADILLEKYDIYAQTQLLRGHYCHSEIQFLLNLENISNRLLIVPKPARVSALRAELTALNHKLPAEVCMPMWCGSSDAPHGSDNVPQPHHRIVRVPPGESVVLNSAERAPYLLLVEILHDDLDFDPSKRANKEVLRKIVTKENERKGTSKDLVPFGQNKSRHQHQQPPPPNIDGSDLAGASSGVSGTPLAIQPLAPSGGAFPPADSAHPEEEIDLVEQLYGSGQPFRSAYLELADSIVLPPPPKNKDLDLAAWSASIPCIPSVESAGALKRSGQLITRSQSQSRQAQDNNEDIAPSPTSRLNGVLSLDDYSERMRTAAIMLAQLNANMIREQTSPLPALQPSSGASATSEVPPLALASILSSRGTWIPGTSWLTGSSPSSTDSPSSYPEHQQAMQAPSQGRMRLQYAEAQQIRGRIMKEMLALEEERMERMKENRMGSGTGLGIRGVDMGGDGGSSVGMKSVEDEGIIRRELNKVDPSAVVFSESWAAKKSRIRGASPYGHLANWDCVSVIVKTGGDLRQEQLAVQLIREFQRIWAEENCQCWVRYFRILILGGTSGLVETITDAVSIHSIKKAEYAKRLAQGMLGHVTLMDHFKSTYGDPASAKFTRAQRNFAKSLAGYSIVTFLLQVKDRHNGNILLDRDGHLIHIDFGFILSNTPGNIGFEAAPFKLPPEYIEVLGGVTGAPFLEFKRLFREGFELARKHCDRITTLVELMQKDSRMPCFSIYGEQTASHLRDRFQPTLTHSLIGEYIDRLIDTSLGSNWTRLYDSYQYYSQSIL